MPERAPAPRLPTPNPALAEDPVISVKAEGSTNSTSKVSSPDVSETARRLTTLGITRIKQEGRLNVRQREQLRRAIAKAGEALGWSTTSATSANPIADIRKEVEQLIKEGSRTMKRELEATQAAKESEISELEGVAASALELSESDDPDYPAEISYSHTARDAARGLITNVETHTVSDASEAESVAGTIQKSLNKWDKLQTQMMNDLDEKQRLLNQLDRNLSDFVDSIEDLVPDVLVTLT